jgi:hypothetical protein
MDAEPLAENDHDQARRECKELVIKNWSCRELCGRMLLPIAPGRLSRFGDRAGTVAARQPGLAAIAGDVAADHRNRRYIGKPATDG